MGICTSSPSERVTTVTSKQQIDDRQSEATTLPQRPLGSIAVFGSHDVGKSCLVRKLWLLYGESYSQAERENYRSIIDTTILDGTFHLLHAFLELYPPELLPSYIQQQQQLASSPSLTTTTLSTTTPTTPLTSLSFTQQQTQQQQSTTLLPSPSSQQISLPNPNAIIEEPTQSPGLTSTIPPHGSTIPITTHLNNNNDNNTPSTITPIDPINIGTIPEDLILGPNNNDNNINGNKIDPNNISTDLTSTATSTTNDDMTKSPHYDPPSTISNSTTTPPQMVSKLGQSLPPQPQTILQLTLKHPLTYYYDNPQYLTTYPNPTNELIAAIYTFLQMEYELYQTNAPATVNNVFAQRSICTAASLNGQSSDLLSTQPSAQRQSFALSFNARPNNNTTTNNTTLQQIQQIPPMSPYLLFQQFPITITLAQHILTFWQHPIFRYIYQHSHMLYKATPILNNVVHINNNNNNLVMFCEGYLQRLIQSGTDNNNNNNNGTSIIQDLDLLLMKNSHYHRIADSPNQQQQLNNNNKQDSIPDNNDNNTNDQTTQQQQSSIMNDGTFFKPNPSLDYQFEPYDRYLFETAGFLNIQEYFQQDLKQQENNYVNTIRQEANFNTPFSDVFRTFINEHKQQQQQQQLPTSSSTSTTNDSNNKSNDNITADTNNTTTETNNNGPIIDGPTLEPIGEGGLHEKLVRVCSTLGPDLYLDHRLYDLDNIEEPTAVIPNNNNNNNNDSTQSTTTLLSTPQKDSQQSTIITTSSSSSTTTTKESINNPNTIANNNHLQEISEDATLPALFDMMPEYDTTMQSTSLLTPTKRGSISFRVTSSTPRNSGGQTTYLPSTPQQDKNSSGPFPITPARQGSINELSTSPNQSTSRLLRPSSTQATLEGPPILKQPTLFTDTNNNDTIQPLTRPISSGSQNSSSQLQQQQQQSQCDTNTTNQTNANNDTNDEVNQSNNQTTTTDQPTTTPTTPTESSPTTPEEEQQQQQTTSIPITQDTTTISTTTDTPQPATTTTTTTIKKKEPTQTSLSIFDCSGTSRGQAEWPLVMRQDIRLIYYVVSLTEFLNTTAQQQYGFLPEVINNDRTTSGGGRGRSYSTSELLSEGDSLLYSPGVKKQMSYGSPLIDTTSNNVANNNTNNISTNKYFLRPDQVQRYVRKNILLFTKTINSHIVNRETEIIVVFSKYDLLVKHLAHQKQWYIKNQIKQQQQQQQQQNQSSTSTSSTTTTTVTGGPPMSPFASTVTGFSTLPQDQPHIILFNEIFTSYTGDNFDAQEITQFLIQQYLAKLSIQDKDVTVVCPQSGIVYLQNKQNHMGDEQFQFHHDALNNISKLLHGKDKPIEQQPKQRRKTIFTFDLDAQYDDGQQPPQQQQPELQQQPSIDNQPQQQSNESGGSKNDDDNNPKDLTEQQQSLLRQEIVIRDTVDCSSLFLEPISRLVSKNTQQQEQQ